MQGTHECCPAGGPWLIRQSSPLVDDKMLKDMSSSLTRLERLNLWGCIRTTREGVYSILGEAGELKELSLDAVPHSVSPIDNSEESMLIHRICSTYLALQDSSICIHSPCHSRAPIKNIWT